MSEENGVTVSKVAAQKAREAIEGNKEAGEYDMEKVGIRFFVQGGGCSGFQYGLAIEDKPNDNDTVVESNGIKIYVDPISIRYVKGTTIDWELRPDALGNETGAFKYVNPNATGTCGCGSSFTADPDH